MGRATSPGCGPCRTPRLLVVVRICCSVCESGPTSDQEPESEESKYPLKNVLVIMSENRGNQSQF